MSSVVEQVPLSVHTGNGVATTFGYEFQLLEAGDLVVSVSDIVIPPSEYVVNGVGVQAGGDVVFSVAPAAGADVVLRREVRALRDTDYQYAGDFREEVVDRDFNRIWHKIQEMLEWLGRAFVLPWGSSAPIVPTPDSGKYLRWRDDLLGLENADVAMLGGLGIPVSISDGGTGASSRSAAITNLGFIDIATETTITGPGTLDSTALGRAFLLADSGSPADYQVMLPAGAPPGSLIFFRVADGATKLYTLHGNDVGLGGQPTRTMWRGESCLLYRGAAEWIKLAGRTIPFRGVLQRPSAQSITSGTTWQKAMLTDEVGDTYNLDLCLDVANGRFSAPRQGSYSFAGSVSISASVSVSAASAELAISRNGSSFPTEVPGFVDIRAYAVGDSRATLQAVCLAVPMNAGDYVELLGRIHGGTIATPAFEYVSSTLVTGLLYEEIPLW